MAASSIGPTSSRSPKDVQTMIAILKDMGVTEYEPRVINQMLEFTYRYVTDILDDAQIYCNHAGKKVVDGEDVQLAVQTRMDHSFTCPPPRELLLEVARVKNNSSLPAIKPHNGPNLPPDRYCFSSTNYRLRSNSRKTSGMVLPSRLSISSSSGKSATITLTSKSASGIKPGFTHANVLTTQSSNTSKAIPHIQLQSFNTEKADGNLQKKTSNSPQVNIIFNQSVKRKLDDE
ncbi:transcription initiation factor TFIID subunit 9-like [Anneissia japonica]|uniref:transcription initiation factor TFIID subunit 9-like n=1 Tax=Anneissia japonica TaxID=1529436 RepID=UPI0014259A3A|nr:transcription initiation factor TFIID subunit 9-like [Anneissia japonica]